MKRYYSPLYCDLYHLIMIQSLIKTNKHTEQATYELFIRQTPFGGSYLLVAGVYEALDVISNIKFEDKDIEYLKSIGYFDQNLLDFLRNSKINVSIEAIEEGALAFPNEPIMSVSGQVWECLLIESILLNIVNSQSLIATKASRVVYNARKKPVVEFGLRRANDFGGLIPSRASFIGGCVATSNVEAGFQYGIPVMGTLAHTYIMQYGANNELLAFEDYLRTMPNNATLLIDTYDTLNGVQNAIKASINTGVKLTGVRIDSGDLSYLSQKVRQILNQHNFTDTKIIVSNDIDEYVIHSLLTEQDSSIDSFGVGTKLVTSHGQPALGGVYKLKEINGTPVMKISNDVVKRTIPGKTNVIRIINDSGNYSGDVIVQANGIDKYRQNHSTNKNNQTHLDYDIYSINIETMRRKRFEKGTQYEILLKPVMINGTVLPSVPKNLYDIQNKAKQSIENLETAYKRLFNPHTYVVGVEYDLYKVYKNTMKTIENYADE